MPRLYRLYMFGWYAEEKERLRLRGNLLDGVPLDNGGTLRIEINCIHEALPDSLPDDQADNRILKVCRHLQQCQPILVTKDLVLRLKAHDECERSPLALDAIQRL